MNSQRDFFIYLQGERRKRSLSIIQSDALSYQIGCTQLKNRVHSVIESGALS